MEQQETRPGPLVGENGKAFRIGSGNETGHAGFKITPEAPARIRRSPGPRRAATVGSTARLLPIFVPASIQSAAPVRMRRLKIGSVSPKTSNRQRMSKRKAD